MYKNIRLFFVTITMFVLLLSGIVLPVSAEETPVENQETINEVVEQEETVDETTEEEIVVEETTETEEVVDETTETEEIEQEDLIEKETELEDSEKLEEIMTLDGELVTPFASGIVNSVAELETAVAGASNGDVITLSSSFPTSVIATISLVVPDGISITIDGADQTYAASSGPFFTITGNATLKLQNFNFDGGTDAIKHGNGTLYVEDSTFINLNGGTAITGVDGVAGTVFIENCLFKDNSAYRGAAIMATSSSTYNVNNSSFISNHGTNGGYDGGAISADQKADVTIKISNSYFEGNTIINGTGGAVGWYNTSGSITIDQSVFVENSATGGNSTADGGAFSVKQNNAGYARVVTYEVTNSTFDRNTANDDGAAILIEGLAGMSHAVVVTGKIDNNTFYKNVANGAATGAPGGAIQFYGKSTNGVSNNTFYQNSKVSGTGGAIGRSGVYAFATIYRLNNVFVGNTASSGTDTTKQVSGGTLCGGELIEVESGAESIFGTATPVLATNNTAIYAGANVGGYSPVVVSTLYIAPNLGISTEKYADGIGLNAGTNGSCPTPPTLDQRGAARGSVKDSGAVEIVSARFNANGGSWNTTAEASYSYSNPIRYNGATTATIAGVAVNPGVTVLSAPGETKLTNGTKTFLGWDTNPSATTPTYSYTSGNQTQVPMNYNSTDVTYYAIWATPVSNVTLTYSGNTTDTSLTAMPSPISETVASGTPIAITSSVPTRDNLTFKEWNTKADGTGTGYTTGNITITTDTTLYAIWNVTLTYDGNTTDTSLAAMPSPLTSTHQEGSSVGITSSVPTRDNLTFKEWNTKADGTGTAYTTGNITLTANTTLYAIWNVTLTYDGNTTDTSLAAMPSPLSSTHKEGTAVAITSSVPTRDNATFKEWNTKADGTGTAYTTGNITLTANTTLYAIWNVTLTYDANAADTSLALMPTPLTATYKEGTNVVVDSIVPTRDYYVFTGWNTKADGTGTPYSPSGSFILSENTTLYAQWVARVVTVEYFSNCGGDPTTSNIPIGVFTFNAGDTVTVHSVTPTREEHEFTHYEATSIGRTVGGQTVQPGETFVIETHIQLYAQWTPKEAPKPPVTPDPETPNTGVDNSYNLYTMSVILGMGLLTAVLVSKKRKESN